MEIIIFSDSKVTEKGFAAFTKKKGNSLRLIPVKKLKSELTKLCAGSVVYVDITSLPAKDHTKTITMLNSRKDLVSGLIDPKGILIDIASFFHKGGDDYIGKELFKKGITADRISALNEFHGEIEQSADTADDNTIKSLVPSGRDWTKISQGNEYTFCMMFIELDRINEIKRSQFGAGAANPVEIFRSYVENHIVGANGKIWMWMESGGLILFPFDGKSCDNALVAGFRMMLNRKIYSIEQSIFNTLLSFRIAVHIGNTVYKKRGDTGTIVSDSINSIFHLGQKFAEPGSLYLTEHAHHFAPEGMKPHLKTVGQFEGREIFRMKNVL